MQCNHLSAIEQVHPNNQTQYTGSASMLHGIVPGMPIIVHKCPTQYQECLYTIVMQSPITAIGQVAERLGTRLACTGISLTYIGPLVDVTCLMREHTFS